MNDVTDQVNAAMADASAAAARDMLTEATNLLGNRLSADATARILTLLRTPTPAAWDEAHSIILNGSVGIGRTLWQALLRVDPSCPRSGRGEAIGERLTPDERWDGYAPEPMLVLAAIRAAVTV